MWQGLFDLEGFVWEGKPGLVGASVENKKLDEELKAKKMKVQSLKVELDLEIERGKRMQGHFSDLTQEKNYLLHQKHMWMKEMENLESSHKIFSREMSHVLQEMNSMKKDLDTAKSRKALHEKTIAEQAEKSKTLKSAINWEEEALLKWLNESAQIERDKIALIKYTHQDDSKIKEIGLLLERLGKECRSAKTILEDTDTELSIAQSEMDRIQGEFQKAHSEREDIIANWEKVLQRLQSRNEEIDSLSQYTANMREKEKSLNERLNEKKLLLASEVASNEQLRKKIAEQEGFASKLRMNLNEQLKMNEDLHAEVERNRNSSVYLGYKVQNTRTDIQNLEKQIEQKDEKLKGLEKARTALQKDIDSLTKEAFDTDHYTRELDKLIQKENRRLKEMNLAFNVSQNLVIKHSQELREIAEKEKSKESEIKAMKVSSRNLGHVITKLDQDRIEQQKLLAGMNMCIKQVEQRVKVMEGELANEEEKWELEQFKQQLEASLVKKIAAFDFLNDQMKKMMEKINVSIKTLECRKKQNDELTQKIDFLEYFITNSQKALKHEREKKETLLVEECMAKLQLYQYHALLLQRNEAVTDLQKNQAEYGTAMKERMLELIKCRDMVQTEIRKEEEECYQVRRQVQEGCDKIAKYQTRYEVELKALGLMEAGDNPQVNVLLKAENEKRALQQERDELVSKVVHCEDELHALQNTLWIIQTTNEHFRQMLNPPGLTAEEHESLKKLEKEQQLLDLNLHSLIQRTQDLSDTLQKNEELLNELNQKTIDLENGIGKKTLVKEALVHDISELQPKLARADKSNSRIAVDAFKYGDELKITEDMKIHILRDLRKRAGDHLFLAASKQPEAIEELGVMFENAQLPLPPRGMSLLSSKSSMTSLPLPKLMKKLGRSASPFSSSTTTRSTHSGKSDRTVLSPSIVSLGSSLSDRNSSTGKSYSSSTTEE